MPKVYLSPAYHYWNPCAVAGCDETTHNNLYLDVLEPYLAACGIQYKRGPRRTPKSGEDGDALMLQAVRESDAWGADVHYVSHTNAANGSVRVVESLKNFYKSRAIADGGSEAGDDLDLNLERARHERTKREISELKLAKLQGSVYDARTVEYVMTELYAILRAQLLGIPFKLAPQLEGQPKEEIYLSLTREIEDRLSDVAGYDPKMFLDADVAEKGEADEDS